MRSKGGESVSGFNSLILRNPSLGNLKRLFELLPNFWKNFYNSVFTTFFGTVTSLFFCSLAGFAFAKYKFPGNKTLFYFCVATMLIPPEVGSIPMFLVMRKMELINSLWSLVIPRMATAIGIFYMRQYIMDVPDEIIESARIKAAMILRISASSCPLSSPRWLPGAS
ncbi:MAG: carbohydrate ABC transporter permease [Enterocloster sp.]